MFELPSSKQLAMKELSHQAKVKAAKRAHYSKQVAAKLMKFKHAKSVKQMEQPVTGMESLESPIHAERSLYNVEQLPLTYGLQDASVEQVNPMLFGQKDAKPEIEQPVLSNLHGMKNVDNIENIEQPIYALNKNLEKNVEKFEQPIFGFKNVDQLESPLKAEAFKSEEFGMERESPETAEAIKNVAEFQPEQSAVRAESEESIEEAPVVVARRMKKGKKFGRRVLMKRTGSARNVNNMILNVPATASDNAAAVRGSRVPINAAQHQNLDLNINVRRV